jgi:phage/conjugal plasmid C-4 type zinc finger TraR family protein
MPDLMDFAQSLQSERTQDAITEFLRLRRLEATQGLRVCYECGDPITDARRLSGAVRCVECQTVHEARERIVRGSF